MNFETYRHQVGGHSQLMKPKDSSKVYKPLVENEYLFYEKFSSLGASNAESGPLHILKKFLPKYYGVTEIRVHTWIPRDGKQQKCLPADIGKGTSAIIPESYPHIEKVCVDDCQKKSLDESAGNSREWYQRDAATQKFEKIRKSGSEAPAGQSRGQDNRCNCFPPSLGEKCRKIDDPTFTAAAACAEKIVDKEREGMNTADENALIERSFPIRHIVLEDLVYGFDKPCVLDIKMGKRQRKLGASAEKDRRQLEKSLKTTSHELGFRLCGYQYYDKRTDTLCYRDKYWGRKLTKEKVQNAILQWFCNGYCLYFDLISILLEKLNMFFT